MFLVSEGIKKAEAHQQFAAKNVHNCLAQLSTYDWTEMFKMAEPVLLYCRCR
jgi:hypothetical protein